MSILDLAFAPPEWTEQALCAQVDPELFYPEKGATVTSAKKVCGACTVRAECLTYALETRERFGVWGGLAERERRVLLRQQGIALDAGDNESEEEEVAA